MLGAAQMERKVILDFGCGPGTFGILLGRRNTVVGVDIAKQALEQAIARARIYGSNFQAIECDGEILPLRSESFDVIFVGWALHHFPRLDLIIIHLGKMLKPGGLLMLVEPNEDSIGQRVSRSFEDMLRKYILNSGLDTPNRSTHTRREYETLIRASGFSGLKVLSSFNGERPELPVDMSFFPLILLKIVISIRWVLFTLSTKLFHSGPDLLIVARKCKVKTE